MLWSLLNSYPDPYERFWFLFWNSLSKSTSWAPPCFQRHRSGVHLLQGHEQTPYVIALQSFALTLSFPLSFFMAFLFVCPVMCMRVCMYLNVEARGHPQTLSLGCPAWSSLCGWGSLATELLGSACPCVPSTGVRRVGNAWLLPFARVLGMGSVHWAASPASQH